MLAAALLTSFWEIAIPVCCTRVPVQPVAGRREFGRSRGTSNETGCSSDRPLGSDCGGGAGAHLWNLPAVGVRTEDCGRTDAWREHDLEPVSGSFRTCVLTGCTAGLGGEGRALSSWVLG